MRWRDYDPQSKRFIVPDTYEGAEDSPLSQNRYLYAEGDPVNYVDPSGNTPEWLNDVWEGTKDFVVGAYNFWIGDDIHTLFFDDDASGWEKAYAAGQIILNFVPGGVAVRTTTKAVVKIIKVAKDVRRIKKFVGELQNGQKIIGKNGSITVRMASKASKTVNGPYQIPLGQGSSSCRLKLDLQLFASDYGKSQKGKVFRGGSKAQRDKWYGYGNNKDFVNWWHRKGKEEFGGYDIQDKYMADEAYESCVGQGKPKSK